MALSDYINRKYDLLALQNTPTQAGFLGRTKLGFELFNENTSGKITTGIQKLAQRWLLEFTTELGSMPGKPTRGTNFMRAARTGRFRIPLNVQTEFAMAEMTLRNNLREEETEDMPSDERYGNSEIINIAILPGYDVSDASGTSAVFLSLGVRITSRAGDARDVILPIEIVPRN